MHITNTTNSNTNTAPQSAFSMIRKIGGTLFRVKVFSPQEGQEDMETKILRMIRNDCDFSSKTGFPNDAPCGTISLPQMSCPA